MFYKRTSLSLMLMNVTWNDLLKVWRFREKKFFWIENIIKMLVRFEKNIVIFPSLLQMLKMGKYCIL